MIDYTAVEQSVKLDTIRCYGSYTARNAQVNTAYKNLLIYIDDLIMAKNYLSAEYKLHIDDLLNYELAHVLRLFLIYEDDYSEDVITPAVLKEEYPLKSRRIQEIIQSRCDFIDEQVHLDHDMWCMRDNEHDEFMWINS
jgi:hypothetical protein